jgi:hypothetical protein
MSLEMTNGQQQFENASCESPERTSSVVQQNSASPDRNPSRLIAKLPFIRTMLWVLVYATTALFLMSLILLGGWRLQSKIIGGALAVVLALIAATYAFQWYS